MEKMKVRDLMRPVEEYPRISSKATFLEAVEALEKAQQDFESGKASVRTLLVFDDTGQIMGKLSPMDVVQGLEPNYSQVFNEDILSRFSLGRISLDAMNQHYRFWQKPLTELCQKAFRVKIENFVRMPTPDHMVTADDKLEAAFHLFVLRRHDSLFVKDGGAIVGLIRFSDVYRKIKQTMRECPVPA
jgi:CBS domain-containing protein